MTTLNWLPIIADWRQRLKALPTDPTHAWESGVSLAKAQLNFVLTNALDDTVRQALPNGPRQLDTKTVRLAVLSSSTIAHLLPSIRVAGLRRGIWIETYHNGYGEYLQELSDLRSPLFSFKPTAVLFALDAQHLTAAVNAEMDEAAADREIAHRLEYLKKMWRLAREAFNCPVLQQTALPVHPALFGNNEHRLPGSRRWYILRLNAALRRWADESGVDLLALDDRAAQDGLARWHDPALWHRSKQEVALTAAPLYGDLVARWIAAKQGRSLKCLVLDLDNTLWGGVIGDDGLEGIVLGQGSPLGEAYVAVQEYARDLKRRGVILAVCTKNDEANALEAFEKHPEMVLRRGDIACFVANWRNKADNIRVIASELNIALDAICFLDDNPFERYVVRRELPMVCVPEVPEDPTAYPLTLSDAGYFEGIAITDEDRERTAQYQGNKARDALMASVTDLSGYLRSLEMRLLYKPFDALGLKRIVQLINKSNQFNLRTRRYSDEDIFTVMADPGAVGLQLRLLDRFGDNGVIAVIIGRLLPDKSFDIDTWVMSCRVLGRQVEAVTLNLIARSARAMGARRLVGEYIPTTKNGMVKDHYVRLNFKVIEADPTGRSLSVLELDDFVPNDAYIQVMEG